MKKTALIMIVASMICLFFPVEANNSIYAEIVDYSFNVNGEKIELHSPVVNIDGTAYVPVREVANLLDAEVYWNGDEEKISLFTGSVEENVIHYKSDNWKVFSESNYGKKLFGYKDENGDVVIEPAFTRAGDFHEGRAVVKTYEQYISDVGENQGIINETGAFVVRPAESEDERYIWVGYSFSDYSEGYAAKRKTNLTSACYVDRDGNEVFGKTFRWAYPFSEGYAVVMVSGAVYPRPQDFEETDPDKYSYIDKNGNMSDKEWDYATSFKNGTAIVEADGVRMRIDKNFEVVEYIGENKS